MARDNDIYIEIANRKLDINPEGQVPLVSYALEDEQNFENKKSAESYDIFLVPTLENQQAFNSMQNPSVLDYTPSRMFEKPQAARYMVNGYEVLTGKFFLESIQEQNGRVTGFKGKIYGLNGDWAIALKEKKLYDFLNPVQHTFDLPTIINSWNFDGRSEQQDYVYGPVRYRKPFGDFPAPDPLNPDAATEPDDTNVIINDLKPSLSIYWILYRGFKSLGYRIVSDFFDTDYYRRSVLIWTWGGFDYLDDTRWQPLRFLAKAPAQRFENDQDSFVTTPVVDNVPGAFDNSDTYQYTGAGSSLPYAMVWTYKPIVPGLGKCRVNLSVQLNNDWKLQKNSKCIVRVLWYKNGILTADHEIINREAPNLSLDSGVQFDEDFYETDAVPGDYIACRVHVYLKQSLLGFARNTITIEQFSLNFMKLTEGSTISLLNYPKFKNFGWLDLLRGEIDFFDLEIQTDPVKKEVYIEPRHEYEINGVKYSGYFTRKQLDYSQKRDLSKQSELILFSEYEREFTMSFKEDPQDGGLKKVQDRNQTTIGLAKYLLPERFKTGKKDLQNRFYSALMHYEHDLFKFITGIAPQFPSLYPENVANTSSEAAENIFQPKRAWYKGNVAGVGGWKFNGQTYTTIPFLFAVNMKAGGEADPVFSYADQNIKGVLAKGLLRKFYLQRMAIYRHGRKYLPIHLRLDNSDVCNYLHRESVVVDNIEYLLINIKDYNPVNDDSTECQMWMFVPVSKEDDGNVFPSNASLQNLTVNASFDVKYWPHLLLNSDLK